jgi:hypothetical protein
MSAIRKPRSPLWAINLLTFLASIGTGIVWNGLSFVAESTYHFEKGRTLTMYLLMGVTYVVSALSTGRVLRALERFVTPRSALGLILLLEAAICFSSWLWPIIESYVTAGRHGAAMRDALGWWNVCWTSAVAASMVVIGPLIKDHGRDAIALMGAVHAVALVPLIWLSPEPDPHDEELHAAAVDTEYPWLLDAARLLLPISYVLNSAMSPLLPYLMNALHIDKGWQTPATSTWMWARIAAIFVMWRAPFWHGRWGTMLLGGAAMTLGFGIVVTTSSMPSMLVGLGTFGAGMGIIYYAALYYAMAVGRAQVDAGGAHEALIGVGYSIGPLTGLVCLGFSNAGLIGDEAHFNQAVVALVWLLTLITLVFVMRAYLRARCRRSNF